jgi:hypothetical protein
MTPDQIIDLLTTAAAFDRRTVGDADVIAWHAAVGDLPFADAQAAVVQHYAESTDWLMPAHVRKLVRRIRELRIAAQPIPDPGAELAADPAAFRQALRSSIASIADGFDVGRAIAAPPGQRRQGPPPDEFEQARDMLPGDHNTRRLALTVTCPHCCARPGKPCTLAGTSDPIQGRPAHDARIDTARSQP